MNDTDITVKAHLSKRTAIYLATLVTVLVIMAIAGLVLWQHHVSSTKSTSTTIVSNGEVRLHGKITNDTCAAGGGAIRGPAGDVGCSITVNGYSVAVQLGNIIRAPDPGTITGLDTTKDQTGEQADIYAKIIDSKTASIWDNSKYYVRITR